MTDPSSDEARQDDQPQDNGEPETEARASQSLIEHLLELRSRLLRCVFAVVAIFFCLVPFSRKIYLLVAAPLLKVLPAGTHMIATDVAAPFLVPFKTTIYLAILMAIPVMLHQGWAFVAPGLYRHEKRIAVPLLVSSVLLFYAGAAFAYFVVFPMMFGFFTSMAPAGVQVMTDISRYLDFVIKLFLAFGLTFEIPIAIVLLVWTGFTSVDSLKQKRPYVVVICFIVGMLLTPPDAFSQTMLAVPMWMLFESGLLFARLLGRQQRKNAAAANDTYSE